MNFFNSEDPPRGASKPRTSFRPECCPVTTLELSRLPPAEVFPKWLVLGLVTSVQFLTGRALLTVTDGSGDVGLVWTSAMQQKNPPEAQSYYRFVVNARVDRGEVVRTVLSHEPLKDFNRLSFHLAKCLQGQNHFK